jgi:uncharacterized phiE125 gp8 family phage protein
MSSLERYFIGGSGGNGDIEPHRSLSLVTAPATEPITRDEAKLQCRVDGSDEDDYFDALIQAARQYAEEWTGRRLVNSVWNFRMDQFPGCGTGRNSGQRVKPGDLIVPYPPLVSVGSISYVGGTGATLTFPPSSYIVDAPAGPNCDPGRISLAYGASWPTAREQANAVTVQYTAGYGGSIPALIIAGMKLFIGHLYEHRETVNIGGLVTTIPLGVQACWGPFRVYACA